MKRAILYTRFSPRRNADQCESCEVQQAYCEQYAAQHDLNIVKVFHDPDSSGADEHREKLWSAIEALRRGDVLLCYKRDRLARNVYLSAQIDRLVAAKAATIMAASGDVQGNDPEHIMIRQITASIAEYERKLIASRTRHAMLTHQRNGRRMSRIPPYGWATDPNNSKLMVPNVMELEAIQHILAARKSGKSICQIVTMLNETMPGAARSGSWNVKAVWSIIRRDAAAA